MPKLTHELDHFWALISRLVSTNVCRGIEGWGYVVGLHVTIRQD